MKRIAFGLDIFGWVKNLEDGRIEGDVKDTRFSLSSFIEEKFR